MVYAAIHERGGIVRGTRGFTLMPKRPYLKPAMDIALRRAGELFKKEAKRAAR